MVWKIIQQAVGSSNKKKKKFDMEDFPTPKLKRLDGSKIHLVSVCQGRRIQWSSLIPTQ